MSTPSTLIKERLRTAIAAMSVATGYHFNYGSVEVHFAAPSVYPTVFLSAVMESGQGAASGHSGGLHHKSMQIVVTIKIARPDPLPTGWTIDAYLDDVEEDFLRLVHNERQLDGAALIMEYVRSQRRATFVRAYPGEIDITLEIRWRVRKENPAQVN